MRGFLRIGKVTGIPVSVHWTLAVIAWFLGVGLATGALPASVPNASTTAYWATAGVGVVAFFLSILLHGWPTPWWPALRGADRRHRAVAARRHGPPQPRRPVTEGRRADRRVRAAGQHPRRRGLHRRGHRARRGRRMALVPAMIAWLGIVNIIIACSTCCPARR